MVREGDFGINIFLEMEAESGKSTNHTSTQKKESMAYLA